jgi:serine/threonine-protein kinase
MAQDSDYLGQTLENRYAVDRLLGKGGMGAVYQGRHTVIGRKVAIKFLHAELAGNDEVIKRFYREAQAAAAIGHRNIIEVLDVGVSPKNEPFIVMEYLEGESLGGMLSRTGPIDLAAACGVLEPALLALHAAHEKGIVHRDLKPDNIFLAHEPGAPPLIKLIDFGISKFTPGTGASQLTQTGTLLGTPAYMSPEQARGDKTMDHRTDIYAMGVILYQMLTGRLPFTGEHYNELLINVLTTAPRPPREMNPAFPAEAEPLVLRCLSKDPAERPTTALGMIEELKALQAFAGRTESLTHFAAGATERSFAGGDLGPASATPRSGRGASNLLADLQGTPARWTGTVERKPRRGLVIGLAAAAVAAVGVALFLALTPGPSPAGGRGENTPVDPVPAVVAEPAAPDPGPEAPAAPAPVRITVVGAPEGATILYDGTPVPANPFPVERKETMARIEVRAEGFEPFVTAVIPSADATVKVALEALAARERDGRRRPASRESATAAQAPIVPPAAPTAPAVDPPVKKKYKEGKAGAKVGTDFE